MKTVLTLLNLVNTFYDLNLKAGKPKKGKVPREVSIFLDQLSFSFEIFPPTPHPLIPRHFTVTSLTTDLQLAR